MTEKAIIKIKIFNKDYQIKCPIDKQNELLRTAKFINEKINNTQIHQGLDNFDGIATVATLNFTNELLNQNHQKSAELSQAKRKIKELESTIDELIRAKTPPLRKPNISLEELL